LVPLKFSFRLVALEEGFWNYMFILFGAETLFALVAEFFVNKLFGFKQLLLSSATPPC
jgi:hypothetical protein